MEQIRDGLTRHDIIMELICAYLQVLDKFALGKFGT